MTARDVMYRQPITLLLLGVDGVGKRRLAVCLKERTLTDKPPVNVRIFLNSSTLEQQEHYDLVVVMLDLTNASSVNSFNNLVGLTEDVLLGKLCFAIIGTKYRFQNSTGYDNILKKITLLDAPLFHTHLKTDEDFKVLAIHLMTIARVTSGLVPEVSPLLLSHFNRTVTFPSEFDSEAPAFNDSE